MPSHRHSPVVSIIVPTKDRALLLRDTLASIQAQTYASWEAVVVDDGSVDGTEALLGSFSRVDSRILFRRRSTAPPGAPGCRNEGLRAAGGDYVLFLDSDDCLAPFCLQRRIEVIEAHPELDFAVFPCQMFREKPGDTALLWNADTGEDDIDRFLQLDVPWSVSSPLWRRPALDRLGAWDEELLSWQDWEFHLRAVIRGFRYRRFAGADCFIRLPHKGTIGRRSVSAEHLCSHERLLSRIQAMLSEARLLTQRRQQLLAGLYFWLAERWAAQESPEAAAAVWAQCRAKKLISSTVYREGILYLRVWRRTRIRRWMRAYLAMRWPGALRLRPSPSFRNTPLQHDQGPVHRGELVSVH